MGTVKAIATNLYADQLRKPIKRAIPEKRVKASTETQQKPEPAKQTFSYDFSGIAG